MPRWTPEARRAASERMRRQNADPVFRERAGFLPWSSPAEVEIYLKLRKQGLSRTAAFAEATRARDANGANHG